MTSLEVALSMVNLPWSLNTVDHIGLDQSESMRQTLLMDSVVRNKRSMEKLRGKRPTSVIIFLTLTIIASLLANKAPRKVSKMQR